MGSCVSVNKDPDSAVEIHLSAGSKDDKLLIASPVKSELDKVNGGDFAVAELEVKTELATHFRNAEGFVQSKLAAIRNLVHDSVHFNKDKDAKMGLVVRTANCMVFNTPSQAK